MMVIQSLTHNHEMEQEFQMLRRVFPKKKLPQESGLVNLASIIALIPARSVCEPYFRIYLRYFENLYPVFSVPSLFQQWEQFWESYDDAARRDQLIHMEFVPNLALVLVIGCRLQSFNSSDSAYLPFDPRKLLSMVHTYQLMSSGRVKPSISILQTYALLVLCDRLFSVSSINIWRAAGDLLRLALAMELNQDHRSDGINDTQPEAQLRRQLWCTIANLELDSSLRCGMPSLLQGMLFDSDGPLTETSDLLNLQDVSDNQALKSDFQHLANATFQMRLDALRILTNPTPKPNDVRTIISSLHSIRIDMKAARQAAEKSSQDKHICNAIMLELLLLQPIILLHTLALQLPSSPAALNITFMDCLPACLRVLGQLEALDPEETQFESISNSVAWKLAWAFFGDDVIRAAYIACYFFKFSATRQPVVDQFKPENMIGISDIPGSNVKRAIKDMIKAFLKLASNRWALLKQVMGLVMCTELINQHLTEVRREQLMMISLRQVLDLCREQENSRTTSLSSTDPAVFEPLSVETDMDWFGQNLLAEDDFYSGFFD
jgi:hypothetical protein